MAQAFARLGCRVTLFQAGACILPKDDPELTGLLSDILKNEGVRLYLGHRVSKVENVGGEVRVTAGDKAGNSITVPVEALLVAAGRKANISGLNLESAGVGYTAKGIKVDGNLRTTASHIWAGGDCNGLHQFSHIAEVQSRTILQNILLPICRNPEYAGVPWATFTDPALARLGLTETQAISQGLLHRVYRLPLSSIDRAVVEQEEAGMIKLITTPGGKILGAHILAPEAADLLNEIMVTRHCGEGMGELSNLPHIYPGWGCGIQRATDQWLLDVSKRWYSQFALKTLRKIQAGG